MGHFYKNKQFILSTRKEIDAKADCNFLYHRNINCHTSCGFKIVRIKIKKSFIFDSVLITSKNAVESLSDFKIKGKTIFCVGSATAKKVYESGYKNNIIVGNNDTNDLAKKIIVNLSNNSTILWLTQKNSSNNLIDIFKNSGLKIIKVICYEVQSLNKIDNKTNSLIKKNKVNVILFYSIFSTKIWLRLIKDAKLNKYLEKVYAVTISNEVSSYLSENGWQNIKTARRKNRFAVLAKAIKQFNSKIVI